VAIQLPPIDVTAPPPVADIGAGVGLGADVGAGASAALAGGGLAGATVGAGPLGLMGLVNAFDPSFFGGDPGASPAQIQQNQLSLATAAGYPGTAAGVQAYFNDQFKSAFGISPPTTPADFPGAPQYPAQFSALNQTLPSDVSSLAPTTPDVTTAPTATPASGGSLFPDPSTVQPGVMPQDIASELTMGGGSFPSEGTPYDVAPYSMDTPTADRFGDAFTTTSDVTSGAPGAQQDLGRAIYSGGQFKGIEGVAPAADTGGAGILGSGVSWGDALRFGGPLAALGMLGATMARGPAPLPPAAQQNLAVTGPGSPVYNVSQKYLTEASTGQLQPGETAQIEQYRQNATNQLYQQLANEGVTNPRGDSRFVQGQQAIEQNAQIMYQGFINAAVTNGINALGPTTTALTNAAQLQMEQDQAYRQALASATQAFGVSAALSTIGGARTA
jgi:hypothetical protein